MPERLTNLHRLFEFGLVAASEPLPQPLQQHPRATAIATSARDPAIAATSAATNGYSL